jgi:hypothetical protein
MSRWFRHYAGLCRDDKLVSAAIKAKQPVERVVWVWAAILESAAEIDDDGRYSLDLAEVAYFLRADESDLVRIVECLETLGRLNAGRVVKWGNRQFKSDRSAERVAAHRERKRADGNGSEGLETSRNSDVTLQPRYGNAPETETETERDTEAEKIDNPISLVQLPRKPEAPRPVAKPFPPDGSISYGRFAEISRKAKPNVDPDVVAQAFRSFCRSQAPPIPFDDPRIERRFEGFARNHQIRGH